MIFLALIQAIVYFTLSIEHQRVSNLPVLTWQPVDEVGGSGSGSMSAEFLYSGDVFFLHAAGLTNGGVLVESSIDLTNWHGYPSDGAIATLLPTNNIVLVIPDISVRFFRGRWFQPDFGI